MALGFDHVVANMFFLPLAPVRARRRGHRRRNTVTNLIFAFLGNAVGAGLFVAGAYWYLYVRGAEPVADDAAPHPSPNGAERQGARV